MIEIIRDKIDEISRTCKKHHVEFLYIFGSAVNGNFNNESDIDFLYEFDTDGIDFDNLNDAAYDYADNFFEFKFKLQDILMRKIDLIQYNHYKNPYFREDVERTKQLIYVDKQSKEAVV
jgi:predicted nucleotidyltransferase